MLTCLGHALDIVIVVDLKLTSVSVLHT